MLVREKLFKDEEQGLERGNTSTSGSIAAFVTLPNLTCYTMICQTQFGCQLFKVPVDSTVANLRQLKGVSLINTTISKNEVKSAGAT